jgi:zinc transport system substrate-binding protein
MSRSNRLVIGAWLWLAAAAAWSEPIPVAVSVPPQAYFVERIGGPLVEVETLIPPGSSPATYAPTPRQMLGLSKARLYVLVGHPDFVFERKHILPLLRQRSGLVSVDMSAGMHLLPSAGGGQGHAHGEGDPHVWLAPATVRIAARNIAAGLIRIDPSQAEAIHANLARFLHDIDQLDADIRASLKGLSGQAFMVFHPAWGYFARQYGLEQIAIEAGGKDPGPARLIELMRDARRRGVKVIFVQRGFSTKSARLIATEVGAVVREVDPLAKDWLTNLLGVSAAFRDALEQQVGSP